MKVKLTPASPLLRVSSEDPPVKAKTKSSLEYEAMVLSPFVLITSDTSLLEHGSRRWVKILKLLIEGTFTHEIDKIKKQCVL